ncbi:hypothetical protein DUE52_16115 [Larkinella punicea]|uniref:Uncharacterized protein n=1 Tax=Larkinella punicea TaxID=2315727 RepID=A0A368JR50_9BACT|nr:hypothetical protein DUE52_16115 [Larkinella punicea]
MPGSKPVPLDIGLFWVNKWREVGYNPFFQIFWKIRWRLNDGFIEKQAEKSTIGLLRKVKILIRLTVVFSRMGRLFCGSPQPSEKAI